MATCPVKAHLLWRPGWPTRAFVVALLLFCCATLRSEPISVKYPEGVVHGFLVLHALDGALLANGDLIQAAHGSTVTSRLVFHFKDGSLHDETVTFSQRGHFRVLRDHLVQKGPAFPEPIDMSINGVTGEVRVDYADKHGDRKESEERIAVPSDLANGLIPTLLKNVQADAPPTLSLIAATPKPRLVHLEVSSVGQERFSTGSETRSAIHYVLKVDIGGLAGHLAPLVGKQPPDSHVWILTGEAPAFVRSEQPFYMGGPLWRIDLVSPRWQEPQHDHR